MIVLVNSSPFQNKYNIFIFCQDYIIHKATNIERLCIVEIDSQCAHQLTVGTRQQSGMSQYHRVGGLAWNEVTFCMLHSWLQVAMRITRNRGSQELASEQCPL
jgi:hypothetical protein